MGRLVLQEVRRRVGKNFPVGIRITSDDMVAGGNTFKDTLEILKYWDEYVDVYNVSLALNCTMQYQLDLMHFEDGWRTGYAKKVKETFGKPVIAMGNIRTPELAEKLMVTRQAVSRWETGEAVPDTEKVIQLSCIFHVTTDYLLLDIVEAPQSAAPAENNRETEQRAEEKRMKRQSMRMHFGWFLLIFGIIALSATLVGAGLYAQTLTEWWTNLGRYGTALFDSWVLAPFIVSAALTLCGILILIREYIFIVKE